jgi:hypothetical protein
LSPAGSAATQALRLRSTRSLWDPGYVDESWIRAAGPDGGIVKLIPRMRAWVEEYYPGTELAITEYNWGALDHINGALAQADVLGIFGREGLDLATLWGPPEADQPGAFAFRLYRNYDGAGGRFGGTSVKASSSDEARLAIYAAERSSDRALTVIVINKATTPLTATLTIANASLSGHAAVYRYSPSNLAQIVREGSLELDTEGTDTVFPAQSVTLLVAPTKAPVEFKNHLYLPAVAD